MGIFNRYREDVKRVGAALEPVLGGTLGPAGDDRITYPLDGTRAGHAVQVTLNETHGIFGIACAVQGLSLGGVRLHEEDSIFAGDTPYVAPKLKMSTRWDAQALWDLLPDLTRHTLVDLLRPSSSSMTLDDRELSMLLGPSGLLRQPDADETILRALDRLLAVARALETCWTVDPRTVGAGQSTHVPAARPQPPPPLPVHACDPADIRARARLAHAAMLERFAADLIPAFPAANALMDRDTVKDRVVRLPPRAPSQWASDFAKRTIAVGEGEYRWYFLREDDPGFARVLRAAARYERATGTSLADAPYDVIARLTGGPMMVVVAGQAQIGHALTLLGAMIGDHVFIDATHGDGADSRFEGEPA